MTELVERVAKALKDAGVYGSTATAEQLARAALDAIGIDAILEVLRPFAEAGPQIPAYDDIHDFKAEELARAAALYEALGGT